MTELETLTQSALADIAAAASLDALDALRVSLLGKAGSITGQLKTLGALAPDQPKVAGEAVNRAKDAVAEALNEWTWDVSWSDSSVSSRDLVAQLTFLALTVAGVLAYRRERALTES